MIAKEQVAPSAQTFRLKTALLSKGRTHRILASTRSEDGAAMNVAIKCYAEGGENEFHTHAQEDHTFIILQGRAIFHSPDGPDRELGRNEGILLPRSAFYKFEAVPGEPLVILRVGNRFAPREGSNAPQEADDRMGTNNAPLPAYSAANKHVTGEAIPGAFFD